MRQRAGQGCTPRRAADEHAIAAPGQREAVFADVKDRHRHLIERRCQSTAFSGRERYSLPSCQALEVLLAGRRELYIDFSNFIARQSARVGYNKRRPVARVVDFQCGIFECGVREAITKGEQRLRHLRIEPLVAEANALCVWHIERLRYPARSIGISEGGYRNI